MNKPIIIDYKNTKDLIAAYRQGEIMEEGSLIITSMGPMAKSLKNLDSKRFNDGNVIDVGNLLKGLFPDWYSSTTKLKQFIHLGNIIDELPDIDEETRHALHNSRLDILQSIKILTEAGLTPASFPKAKDEDNDISLFRMIYDRFWKKNNSCKRFCNQVKSWHNPDKPDTLINELQEVMDRQCEKTDSIDLRKTKKIYLHGFYYFTTAQELLLEGLLNLTGYTVVFLNNFSASEGNKADAPYEIWTKNRFFPYGSKERLSKTYNGIIPKHRSLQSLTADKPRYIDIFSGKGLPDDEIGNLKIVKYTDAFSFVRDIQRDDRYSKQYIYTPEGTDIQDIIETFFPETIDKKSILAYPVGQYLSLLYNMWDDNKKSICADENMIQQCLATGWATKNPEDTSICMSTFERILPYFQDCHTINEWEDRIHDLHNKQDELMPLFSSNSKASESVRRWHDILGNPLKSFGIFANSTDDLSILEEALSTISKDANLLFHTDNDEKITSLGLASHFNNLKRILKAKKRYVPICEEENLIIKEMLARLTESRNEWRNVSCRPSDLSEAINLFLGGDSTENTAEDSTTDIFTDTLVDGKMVPRRLFTVESQLLIERQHPAMITFCDSTHLPGVSKPYPWPFNEAVINRLIEKLDTSSGNEQIVYHLEDYVANKTNMRLSNRYVFFLALQLPNIEISWISEIDDQDLSPSPYIPLLLYDKKEKNSIEKIMEEKIPIRDGRLIDDNSKDDSFICNVDEKTESPTDYTVKGFPGDDLPREIEINRNYCPWRNLYDFGLTQVPSFISRFQMKFLISHFIGVARMKYMKHSIVDPDYVIKKNIIRLFSPMWNDTESNEITNYRPRYDINSKFSSIEKDRVLMDTCYYDDSRLFLKYLPRKEEPFILSSNSDAPSYNRCLYCPHRDRCFYQVWKDGKNENQ